MAGHRLAVDEDPGAGETIAVGGKPPHDNGVLGKRVGQPADELGAVHRQTLREDQHQLRPRGGQLGPQASPGSFGIGRGFDPGRRHPEVGLLKLGNRDDERPVGDQVIVDFPGAGAAEDCALGKGRRKLA